MDEIYYGSKSLNQCFNRTEKLRAPGFLYLDYVMHEITCKSRQSCMSEIVSKYIPYDVKNISQRKK